MRRAADEGVTQAACAPACHAGRCVPGDDVTRDDVPRGKMVAHTLDVERPAETPVGSAAFPRSHTQPACVPVGKALTAASEGLIYPA